MTTCAELLEQVLRTLGIDAMYGPPLAGIRITELEDVEMAKLFAFAHEKVNRQQAIVHCGERLFEGIAVTDECEVIELQSYKDIVALPESIQGRGKLRFRLEMEPEMPVPDCLLSSSPLADGWTTPTEATVTQINECFEPVVLAGPGVVDRDAQASLNALAVAASAGVLNTWGAKGVFDWRSRHHLATVGLQQRDFELGGLPSADLIVATGVDIHESPDELWRVAPVVTVAPEALGSLAEHLNRAKREVKIPSLRPRLAAVTQEGWARTGGPLFPSRVTLHYSNSLGGGGLVAADAGLAGYWVARTFSTTELGSAVIPSREQSGFAVAAVIVARVARPWRRALAVVDGQLDDKSVAALEAGSRLGVGVGVEMWSPEGPAIDAADHVKRLQGLTLTQSHRCERLKTDARQLDHMIAVAGPLIAWSESERTSNQIEGRIEDDCD
jgi:hypothetical protein